MKLKISLVVLCLLATAISAFAVDGSMLKPPAGSSVAIVVFEDLECPSCAQASSLLEAAAKQYNVPLVIHDFPLRQHAWAKDAAIIARYIEDKYGRGVSDQFRDNIYQYQPQITKDNLRGYAERFAQAHKIELPFMMDPQGKYIGQINTDIDLGTKVGLTETPTIIVVSNKDWKHVQDRGQLYGIVQQMKDAAGPAASDKSKAAAKPAAKPAAKAKSKTGQ